MRFDAAAHLDAWTSKGAFPAIHRSIREAVLNFAQGDCFLDLCCSYGLIGQFLADRLFTVVGVDRDADVIERARAAGITIPLYHLNVGRETVGRLYEIIAGHRLAGIIARRALPELFDEDLDFGREFFAEVRRCGVGELFLEGRIPTRKAVSALASVEAEAKLVSPWFAPARVIGNVAYLRAR